MGNKKKLDLGAAAEEFEMISSDTHLFYNVRTGEFDFYNDFMDLEDDDAEKFEYDDWVSAPHQQDIGEYDIMVDFAETVSDPRKNELLSVSLEGRGAFRRFKDTLHRVGLIDEWYTFKHEAYIEIAREWCEKKGIEYVDKTGTLKSGQPPMIEAPHSIDFIIIPLSPKIADYAANVMSDALDYSKATAAQEIKRMLSSKRISLVAIADDRVIGIIGAIP